MLKLSLNLLQVLLFCSYSYLYTAIANLLYLDALLIHLWKHYKNDKFPELYLKELFQKKYKQGGGGVDDMEFPGVLKEEHINKEAEFWGMHKKNSCGISMGLGFWPYNFHGVSHNFFRSSSGESLFTPEFLRVKWQI